jgi:serine/threonine protein kinase
LGAGGMGAVYGATRLHIGDEVAVKILHPERSANKSEEDRFRREAQIAARLKHPNAVGIYDFGVTANGLPYLVMELVTGHSLRQLITHQNSLSMNAIVEITNQVCAALDEAHRQGIVHRDIKPDNIIVHASASGIRVKVLDFGVAKLRDLATDDLTQEGIVLGTPRYMSPEQCMGEELDGRSDIYSFGIVLYEMLCGAVPFNSSTPTAVAVQQVTQQPPPLRLINASVLPAVEAVVMSALQKQREARPQTAGALSRQLSSAFYGMPSEPQVFPSGDFNSYPVSMPISEVHTVVEIPTEAIYTPTSANRPTTPVLPPTRDLTQPSQVENKSIILPLIIGIALTLFILVGAIVAILFLPQLFDYLNSKNKPPVIVDGSTPTPTTSPQTETADDRYNKLREKLLNSAAADIPALEQELISAEEKYPNDYRFPYELAKITLNKTHSHREAFEALFRAGRKAIENNKAETMLADIESDEASFRRLTRGHREWKALLKALKEKNSEALRLEGHSH